MISTSLHVAANGIVSFFLWLRSSLPCTGEGSDNPLQCSCLENPKDGGAWWAAVYGVAQSRPWLKRLSSSRSSSIPLCMYTTSFKNCFGHILRHGRLPPPGIKPMPSAVEAQSLNHWPWSSIWRWIRWSPSEHPSPMATVEHPDGGAWLATLKGITKSHIWSSKFTSPESGCLIPPSARSSDSMFHLIRVKTGLAIHNHRALSHDVLASQTGQCLWTMSSQFFMQL